MTTLIVACIIVLYAPITFAADPGQTSPFSSSTGLTIIRPMDNMAIIYDQRGNQMTIYQQGPGLSWYSQEDRLGRITNQGYLFDPFGPRQPLQAPSVTPQPPASPSGFPDYLYGK